MGKDGQTDRRNKKLTKDGSYEQISYTMLYNLGLVSGLSVRDLDDMTVGELLDLSYYRANRAEKQKQENKDNYVMATQADYDNF